MQSLELVFEAREKRAERQLQKKADRQAAKLKAKEAEQQANPTCAKPSKGSQKHTAGVVRASLRLIKGSQTLDMAGLVLLA